MDEKCSNCESKQACVPFFVHENIMMHYNRANKRMLIALCVSLVTLVVGFVILGWLFLSSYNDREKGWQEIIHKRQVTEVTDGVQQQPDP